jgi:hypothetical protein
MRTLPRLVFVCTLAFGFLCLFGLHSAEASGPIIEEFDFVLDNDVFGSCGDFLLIANGAGHVRITTYFDREGQPIRVLFQGHYSGTITNSVNGASLVDSPSVANITFDLIDGTQTNVGAFFNITVPGHGNVYFQVGRIVFDGDGSPVFIAGQQHPPSEERAILCSALR